MSQVLYNMFPSYTLPDLINTTPVNVELFGNGLTRFFPFICTNFSNHIFSKFRLPLVNTTNTFRSFETSIICMLDIKTSITPFQIGKMIVKFISVFMVYFRKIQWIWNEMNSNLTMNCNDFIFSICTNTYNWITRFTQSLLHDFRSSILIRNEFSRFINLISIVFNKWFPHNFSCKDNKNLTNNQIQ